MHPMAGADRQTHRQRLRIACDPCRERKRKCNGSRPCDMCFGYGYECSYRSTARKRHAQRGTGRSEASINRESSPSTFVSSLSQPLGSQEPYSNALERQNRRQTEHQHQEPPPHEVQTQEQEARDPQAPDQEVHERHDEGQQGLPSYLRSVESNSGAAFVRLLTMTLDSSEQSISPMRMLAWNLFLGERQATTVDPPETITVILSEPKMRSLATLYLQKVHPCYGFVDKSLLFRIISMYWNGQGGSRVQEALMCGVAALGCLFSGVHDLAIEQNLVALAKRLLDPSTAGFPSLTMATAWLLRTVYLRLTAKPEEAWIVSCTTLHVIDALGSMSSVHPNSDSALPQESQDIHIRRKVLGVAQHLNIWMSYDLGRSRVSLPNVDTFPLLADSGEYTVELLELLPYSQDLDPTNKLSVDRLVAALTEVLGRHHSEPPSLLAQCNLVLCMYRRLQAAKFEVSEGVMQKVLGLMKSGIQAVHAAIAAGIPWHHVANIPFQVLCMLLVMDTVQSFGLLTEALACVVAVNDAYRTEATREAVTAAHTLLQLHRERRESEIRNHSNMLSLYPSVDFEFQEGRGDLVSGDAMLDSWWFNEFVAHTDLFGPSNGGLPLV
ncbi:hypothetical protein FB567DRAFT_319582 [Paraphoma chrysanthemicola]|uniref:Zn(2)-C6 fungal-type domain-containing protein n=1 Tax=Paraphoma chrysanthemicola TaxID=798071 RepID=A0A8K0RA23_9PLEO|nr:hypothetical protein FB567DRAFT_319582 [Paraphoma chrysanthemicola]